MARLLVPTADTDIFPMVAAAPITPVDLHSFRIAHPVIRTSSRTEVTTVAVLSTAALMLWALVVPLEFLLQLTV